jgi:hypothetical protein
MQPCRRLRRTTLAGAPRGAATGSVPRRALRDRAPGARGDVVLCVGTVQALLGSAAVAGDQSSSSRAAQEWAGARRGHRGLPRRARG